VTSTSQSHSPNSKIGSSASGEAGAENVSTTGKKLSRFFGGGGNAGKKRQRLVMITSSARLIIAASGGEEKKAKMELSLLGPGTTYKSHKDSKGLTVWCVDTVRAKFWSTILPCIPKLRVLQKDKHILFEDPKATTSDPDGSLYSAKEWIEAIDKAREFALSQSLTNSYSGDSTLNDLSSSLPSPTSTLDNSQDGPLEGVNIPSARDHHHRHLMPGGESSEGGSFKGRKRFSKRHSKNGLAAVF